MQGEHKGVLSNGRVLPFQCCQGRTADDGNVIAREPATPQKLYETKGFSK
jgi:hypothetical protein